LIHASPVTVRTIGQKLDHPECICLGDDGTLFTGGEQGQVYRLSPDGQQYEIARTGGFLLGLAIDGGGNLHCCDAERKAVVVCSPDGAIGERSRGTAEHPMRLPNYGVFDRSGNFYVSDSGTYFGEPDGRVYVIDANGRTRIFHHGPFAFANGLAIDPDGCWLYVVQSTSPSICRVSLSESDSRIEQTHQLPKHTVPDGIAFAADGTLVITCYRPDVIYLGRPNGSVELFIEDLTGELLNRPTNVALAEGKMYVANLGGWHVSEISTDLKPAPLHRPKVR
jgi:gluconolactonase